MNDSLLNSLNELKIALNNDERVLRLNELDKKLNNDEDVMRLAYKKDIALIGYEDAIKHFGENSKEASKAQKALHEAKLNLDSNELVKEYNSAYKEVRELYDMINETLFRKFVSKKECSK